ncbi:GspH/FimT family protein [Massilia sp. YIM B04103]|uniref:GspH/FimT family pseudopilin n=1 Tax=Massilia sp. YIM B04103 TaxID=2963106 RepID=UPI00210BF885|nr:GspH/FimT family protein [Massilia sp. YIM B04103]
MLALKGRRPGFSLLELLLVLAVATLLLGIAAPSFRSVIEGQRLRVATADLLSAIHLARSQAIARGRTVLLAASGADWTQGWQVFIDRNANQRRDAGEELLARHDPLPQGLRSDSKFSSPASPPYIAYNMAGRGCAAANSQAARWGTLTLELGGQRRRIVINMLGRARLCDPLGEPAACGAAAP